MKGLVLFMAFLIVCIIAIVIVRLDDNQSAVKTKKSETAKTLTISVEKTKKDESQFYVNERFIIREKMYVGGQTQYVLLIQRINFPQRYTELNSYNWKPLQAIYGSKIFYSYEVNDTIFFDYIVKSRFWDLKK